jgi:hypothetical protein
MPGAVYNFDNVLINVHPDGIADDVRILLLNPKGSVPLVSAIVTMPVSELAEED